MSEDDEDSFVPHTCRTYKEVEDKRAEIKTANISRYQFEQPGIGFSEQNFLTSLTNWKL
jgi:hypothetical protein